MAKELLEWATTLIAFGQFVVESKQSAISRRSTLALCLPRIDFAAAFLAIGVIKGSNQGKPARDQLDRLEKLKGCWVSFVEDGRTKVGLLEKVPDDIHGHCSIRHYKKKLPDFSSMTADE